jgi:DNA mismatch repair ATPase MutL
MPAVISEVVANSWDADAEKFRISLDNSQNTITISDDGVGILT